MKFKTYYSLIIPILMIGMTITALAQNEPKYAPFDPSIMVGSPPPIEKLVMLENWQWQPFNHWAFMHMEQMMKVALVDRGNGADWDRAKLTIQHY